MGTSSRIQWDEATSSRRHSPDGTRASASEPHRLWPRVTAFAERRPVLTVFLLAFFVRIVFVIGITVFADGALFPDSSGYNTLASDVANGETKNWEEGTEEFYNQNATLLLPLTFVYWLVGPRLLAGLMLVAVFGSLAAAGVTRLALEAFSTGWAILAGLTVALFPSQVFWSVVLLKDAASWAVLVGMAVAIAKAGKADGWRLARVGLACVILLVLLVHLRVHTFIVAAWAMAIAAWFGQRQGRLMRGGGALAIALALPWAFGAGVGGYSFVVNGAEHMEFIRTAMAYGAATAFVPEKSEVPPAPAELQEKAVELDDEASRLRNVLATLETSVSRLREEASKSSPSSADKPPERIKARIVALRDRLADARARLRAVENLSEGVRSEILTAPVATPEDESRVRRDLAHLPKGLSVMLLEPYPWQTYDNRNVQFVRLEMLLWYPLLLLALIGISRAWTYRRVLAFPLVAGAAIAGMYALIEGNFGTAYRHRGELVWAVVVLATVGVQVLAARLALRHSALPSAPT